MMNISNKNLFGFNKAVIGILASSTIILSGVANAQSDLDSSLPPSDNFDLGVWKLTLPVSQEDYLGNGDSDAAEILPSDGCTSSESDYQLDDGYSDQNFFYTATDGDNPGAMVFVTPLSEDATTPDTDYVRTELRELYNWTPCDGDGDANWIPSGTHTLSGTLQVTDYYDGDPQTIVGQIHAGDSSYALVKLQWDGPSNEVRAIINADPTESSNFDMNFGHVPGTDEWSYVIEMEDDTVTISVTYDGETNSQSVTFGEGDMSSEWNDYDYYFKAGSYPQAEVGSDGSFEVQFSELEVSHSE